VYCTITDSAELRSEYDDVVAELKRMNIDLPKGLPNHIPSNRKFTLPYSLNKLCGFNVSAKITEIERFIESAPRELPTSFPDLPMPLFSGTKVSERLAIAPVVYSQQVIIETAEQA
jgi:CCR4-NOT transcriptional regulation complex NOT5 subunit